MLCLLYFKKTWMQGLILFGRKRNEKNKCFVFGFIDSVVFIF